MPSNPFVISVPALETGVWSKADFSTTDGGITYTRTATAWDYSKFNNQPQVVVAATKMLCNHDSAGLSGYELNWTANGVNGLTVRVASKNGLPLVDFAIMYCAFGTYNVDQSK